MKMEEDPLGLSYQWMDSHVLSAQGRRNRHQLQHNRWRWLVSGNGCSGNHEWLRRWHANDGRPMGGVTRFSAWL